MKKLVFLGLSAFILAGCSSSISSSNQLVGNWRCTINYDDFNIRTVDKLRFSENGSLASNGTVNYPIQKPIFVYAVQQHGRWNLKNNKIVYRILSESIQRTHSAAIWSELQRDNELQQFEDSLFSSLSDEGNNKIIELTITDFAGTKMDIQQEMKGQNVYKGQCIKE